MVYEGERYYFAQKISPLCLLEPDDSIYLVCQEKKIGFDGSRLSKRWKFNTQFSPDINWSAPGENGGIDLRTGSWHNSSNVKFQYRAASPVSRAAVTDVHCGKRSSRGLWELPV